jgi:hypothetical protein
MSRVCSPASSWSTRATPALPGKGYRFLRLGERIKDGDEYFTKEGLWKPALNVGATNQSGRLYRRKLA